MGVKPKKGDLGFWTHGFIKTAADIPEGFVNVDFSKPDEKDKTNVTMTTWAPDGVSIEVSELQNPSTTTVVCEDGKITIPVSEFFKYKKLGMSDYEIYHSAKNTGKEFYKNADEEALKHYDPYLCPKGYLPWFQVLGYDLLPRYVNDGTTRVFEASQKKKAQFVGTCRIPIVEPGKTWFKFALLKNALSVAFPDKQDIEMFDIPIRHIYRPESFAGNSVQPMYEQIVLIWSDPHFSYDYLPEWCDWRPWVKVSNGEP